MAVYEYADQFERQLAQKYERELVSYELTQSNPGIKFMNAQTIKIPRLTVSGYRDHNRTNMGFNTGTVSNDWEPKKLTHGVHSSILLSKATPKVSQSAILT